MQRELLHVRAVGVTAGLECEIEQRGAGQQHRPLDRVVGKPGVSGQRDPSREQPALVGELDRRAQQRMSGRSLSRARDVGLRGRRLEPVALALERICGQADPLSPRVAEERAPIHRRAAHPRPRERDQEPLAAGGVTP